MSHFTVLVVGDDHESALAPFDEERKTPERREYLGDEDVARMSEHYKTTDKTVLAKKMYDWMGERGGVDQKGRLYRMTTYNRNAKWDWYEVGGRWRGYFLLKDGTRADQCRKGDVDAEAMMAQCEKAARERWAAYAKAIEGTPPHERWSESNAKTYHEQSRVKALAEAGLTEFLSGSADDYPDTEAEMVAQWRAKAFCPFALLVDGEWHERGNMGWFACVSNERDDWPQEFARLWAKVPDDARLTLVDCHI